MSHTRGPWKLVTLPHEYPKIFSLSRFSGFSIAEIDGPESDREANARLICVAPEMFELMSKMLGLLSNPDADQSDAAKLEQDIIRVMRKAEGLE